MIGISDRLFNWMASTLPEDEASWIEDMRSETRHVPPGLKRIGFTLGCLRSCLALMVKWRWGVRRVGQTLLGLAILSFCIGAFVMSQMHLAPSARLPVNLLLISYVASGVLVLTRLDWAKQFSFCAGLGLAVAWLVLAMPTFGSNSVYLRVLFIEAAMIMAMLHIAASFIDWSGETPHV